MLLELRQAFRDFLPLCLLSLGGSGMKQPVKLLVQLRADVVQPLLQPQPRHRASGRGELPVRYLVCQELHDHRAFAQEGSGASAGINVGFALLTVKGRMTKPISGDAIYRRRMFDAELIELCVRWYITYRLSYRDLVAMMAERGVEVSHATILRWVVR